LWLYLATRGEPPADAPLFISDWDRPFKRYRVIHLLQTIGARAGVSGVTVHRFRHTCAIQYLRNGGDPYTLQRLLGHSTLEMVRKYLALAQVDVDNAHRRASPVDNWPL
jgi:integrase/recombinase XerD